MINPRGIVLQTSSKPWGRGPWSSPYIIFDPFKDKGYEDFIHWPGHDKLSDKVPVDRENEWGGEYAPCLIEPYFSPIANNRSVIYFTMSTKLIVCNEIVILIVLKLAQTMINSFRIAKPVAMDTNVS